MSDAKRTKAITIRVSPAELEAIDARARELGLSRSEFLIQAAMGELPVGIEAWARKTLLDAASISNMDDELLTKRERATRLLRELFEHRKRVPIAEIVEAGRKLDVSRRTLTYVARELGIREVRAGAAPGFWERPTALPDHH